MRTGIQFGVLLVYLVSARLSSPAAETRPAAKPSETPRPHVILLSYEDEYKSATTLPDFAQQLRERFGYRATALVGSSQAGVRGLEELPAADALVLYVRRKALPKPQMDLLRGYLAAGKPLVALRTSSHAFAVKTLPEGMDQWPSFDADVLGGNYHGHCGRGSATRVSFASGAAEHPILKGIKSGDWSSEGSLYKTSPVNKDATILLNGTWQDVTHPVAWTRLYGKSRVFYTSLGHPNDFQSPQFTALLINALHWAMDRPVRADR